MKERTQAFWRSVHGNGGGLGRLALQRTLGEADSGLHRELTLKPDKGRALAVLVGGRGARRPAEISAESEADGPEIDTASASFRLDSEQVASEWLGLGLGGV